MSTQKGSEGLSRLMAAVDGHLKTAAAGAAAVTGAFVAGEALAPKEAEAAIIYSGPVSINIPSSTAGIYLNVVTGLSNSNPAAVPGWDVNPWGSTALNFFNPAAPAGGVYVQSGANTANLAAGTLISGASTFGGGTASTSGGAPFVLNSSDNLVGFRFQNEANGNATHFAWMRISLSGTFGAQPRSIVEFAYEDVAGVGILAGDTGVAPVPEPAGVAALGALALGAAGAARYLRRRKNDAA